MRSTRLSISSGKPRILFEGDGAYQFPGQSSQIEKQPKPVFTTPYRSIIKKNAITNTSTSTTSSSTPPHLTHTTASSNSSSTKEASSTLINMMRTRADAVHVHAAFDVSISKTNTKTLDHPNFIAFVNSCNTLQTLSRNVVDKIFYAACMQENSNSNSTSNVQSIGRETFFWAVVRLAAAKFSYNSATSALRRLVQEDLITASTTVHSSIKSIDFNSVTTRQPIIDTSQQQSQQQSQQTPQRPPSRKPPSKPIDTYSSATAATTTATATATQLNWSEMSGVVSQIGAESNVSSIINDSSPKRTVSPEKIQQQQQQEQLEQQEKIQKQQQQQQLQQQEIFSNRSKNFAARALNGMLRRRSILRQAILFERWKNMCLLLKVESKLLENVTKYTKKRLLLSCLRRYHRGRMTITFSKWCRMTTQITAIEDGANKQHQIETMHLIVRLLRERRREWLRNALFNLKHFVELEKSSDCSLEYGKMVEQLETKIGAADALSQARGMLIADEQKKTKYLSASAAKQKEQRIHLLATRVLHNLKKRTVHIIWIRWRSYSTHRCWLRRFIVHKMSEIARVWKMTAFAHWHQKMLEWKSQIKVIGRRWLRLSCSIFFLKWKNKIVEKKNQNQKIKNCVGKLKHNQLFRSFHGWNTEIKEMLHNRWIVTRTVKRMQHRHLIHCFLEWIKYRNKQKYLKLFIYCLVRSFHRKKKRKMNYSFHLWMQSNYQEQRIESLQKRTLLNLSHSLIPRTFFPWKTKTLRAKRNRQISNKMIQKLKHNTMHRSFSTWSVNFRASKQRCKSMTRVLNRLHKKRLTQGLRRWLKFRYLSKEDELYDVVESSDLKRAKKQIYRIYNRRLRTKQKMAFKTWSITFIRNERRLDRIKKKVTQKWYHRIQQSAFLQWQHRVLETKRLKRIGTSVVLRWRHVHLNHTFRTWLIKIEKRIFLRRLCIHRSIQMQRQQQMYTFRLLERAVQERRLLLQTTQVSHRGYRKAALAVFHQLERVTSKRLQDALFLWTSEIQEKKRIEHILERYSQSMVRRSEFKTFRAWHLKTLASMHAKQVMHRVLGTLKHKMLNKYYRRFYTKIQKRILMKHLLRRAITNYYNATLKAGFGAIRTHAHETLAQEASLELHLMEMKTKQHALKHIVYHYQCKSILKAFLKMKKIVHIFKLAQKKAKRKGIICFKKWKLKLLNQMFNTWYSNIQDIQRRKRLYQRVVVRFQKRRSHTVLITWYDYIDRRVCARDLIYKITARTKSRQLQWSLNHWKRTLYATVVQERTMAANQFRYLQTHSAGARLLFSTFKKHVSLLFIKSFHKWSIQTKEAASVERRCRAFVQRMTRLHLSKAFHGFIHQIYNQKKLHASLQNIRIRMQLYIETKAFHQWHFVVNARQQHRRQVHRAMRFWQQMKQHQSFETWKQYYTEIKINQNKAMQKTHSLTRLVDICIHRMHAIETHRMHTGLRTWKTRIETIKRQDRILHRVHLKWRRTVIHSALTTWNMYTEHSLHVKHVVQKATKRILHRKLHQMYTTWLLFCERRDRLRTIVSRHTMKSQLNLLRVAFIGKWLPFSKYSIYTNYNVTLKAKQKENATKRIIHQLRKYYHHLLSKKFHHWLINIQQQKRIEQLHVKMQVRLTQRCQSVAFDTWRSQIEQQIHYKQLMTRCKNRIQNQLKNRSFRTWMQHTHRNVRERSKHSMSISGVRDVRVSDLMRRLHNMAVTRMVHMILHHHTRRTFLHWQKIINQDKYYATLTVMSKRHAEQHLLRTQFHTWCSNVRLVHKLAKMMQRLRLYAVSRCFQAWERKTRLVSSQKSLLKIILFSKCKNCLRQSIKQWINVLRCMKHEENTSRNAVKFWQHRTLALCTRTWHNNVHALVETKRRLNQALSRMKKLKTSSCFHGWCHKVKTRIIAKGDLRRLLISMMKQTQRIYLMQWHTNILKEKKATEQSLRAMSYWKNQQLASSFFIWNTCIQERLRLAALYRKVLSRFFQLRLNQAFQGWWVATLLFKEQTNQLRKVVVHHLHQQQAGVLQRWQNGIQFMKTIEKKRQRAVSRWRSRQLYALFERWAIATEESNHERRLLSRAMRCIRAGVLGRVYRHWHVLAVLRARKLHQLSKICEIIGTKYRSQTMKAFLKWHTRSTQFVNHGHLNLQAMQLEEAAAQTMLLDRQSELWQYNFFNRLQRRRKYFDTFLHWKKKTKQSKHIHWKMKVAMQRLHVLRLARCFEKWSLHTLESIEFTETFLLATKRFSVLLIRVRKDYLRRSFSVLKGEGINVPTALGAPLEVIRQIEWTFSRNLDRGIVAKEHVQDVAIVLLGKMHQKVLVAKLFARWKGYQQLQPSQKNRNNVAVSISVKDENLEEREEQQDSKS